MFGNCFKKKQFLFLKQKNYFPSFYTIITNFPIENNFLKNLFQKYDFFEKSNLVSLLSLIF